MAIVSKLGRSNQTLHRFENGYGASVISDGYGGDIGLFELGVIEWDGDHFSLTYKTPITNDVLGNLTSIEVEAVLAQISALDTAAIDAHFLQTQVRQRRERIAELEAEIAELQAEIDGK